MLLSIFLSHKIPARRFIRCKVMIDEVTAQLLFFFTFKLHLHFGFSCFPGLASTTSTQEEEEGCKMF
jgi:hypothetical protein